LRLNLTPHRRRDHSICRTIGDALDCVSNPGQLECHLIGSSRPLQDDNPFPPEVKSSPKYQPNRDRYARHEYVVTCDIDASTRDTNDVIRKQSFLLVRYQLLLVSHARPSPRPKYSAALPRGVLQATITAKVRTASSEMR